MPSVERTRWIALAACLSLGCIGTSIRGDLTNIHDLTGAESASVSSDDVEAQAPAEAREILKKPIDANTAVRIALLDNRELRATLREIGVSRGQLAQAAVLPNPVVEFESLPERNSGIELRAEYDVTGLVLAPIRANAASVDVDASRFHAAALVIATGYRARAVFYALACAEQKLAIQNQSLDAEATMRDTADAMWRAGNVTELALATQDAAYQTARADAADVELAAADAREALVRVLDLHGLDAILTIDSKLPPVPDALDVPADLEARAIRASFDLKERKSHLEALGKHAGVARAEGWIPDVAADVHAFQGTRDPVTGVSLDSRWAFGAGVRVTVPIFDRKQGTSAAIDADVRAELERYYGASTEVRSRARSIYARLVTAHGRAKQFQNVVVPARKRVLAQATLQYNAMQLDVLQVIAAKQEQLRAELREADALAAYWTARAALDALFAGYAVHQGGD